MKFRYVFACLLLQASASTFAQSTVPSAPLYSQKEKLALDQCFLLGRTLHIIAALKAEGMTQEEVLAMYPDDGSNPGFSEAYKRLANKVYSETTTPVSSYVFRFFAACGTKVAEISPGRI